MKKTKLCILALCSIGIGYSETVSSTAPPESDGGAVAPVRGTLLPDAKAENQAFAKDLKRVVGGRLSYEERIERLKENGGTEECEKAIVECLNWMQKRQNEKGYWEDKYRVAMTGLALLSYLGHGESPGGEGPYDGTVRKAIQYLILTSQKNDGFLAEDLKDRSLAYEHAIAVYALSEAYIMGITEDFEMEGLPEAIVAGANRIVSSQAEDGSWGYRLKGGGDLSIIAWCLQALKAASHTGLPIEGLQESSERGMRAVENHQKEDGSFSYRPDVKKGNNLTGAGVLCHQQWGTGLSPQAEAGVNWIDQYGQFRNNGSNHMHYHHYYFGQVMFEYGGEPWEKYNKSFRDALIATQNSEGAFGKVAKTSEKGIRKYTPPSCDKLKHTYTWRNHYESCLSTLMLEVYFRFLPGTNERQESSSEETEDLYPEESLESITEDLAEETFEDNTFEDADKELSY